MTLTMTTVTHIERERRDVSAAQAQLSRRTKIVATLGPATDPPGVLDALISAGLDVARVNCSHGTAQDVRRRAASVREAADRAGRPIALLLDLQGPKIRLADIEPRTVSVGDEVVFASTGLAQPGDFAIELDGFDRLVTDRSDLVIGDGTPRFRVVQMRDGRIWAEALTSGPLLPRKGVGVTDAAPTLPAITDKDMADLELAVELDADYVAQSFVRSADDVRQLQTLLAARPGERGKEALDPPELTKLVSGHWRYISEERSVRPNLSRTPLASPGSLPEKKA